jgi:DNA-binding transcriptional LysR family regulator
MLDFAEAEQAVMQLQQAPSGLLRITAPIEFGQMFLGQTLGAFMCEHPQISAEVEITTRNVDPVEEGVDIAIMVGQPHDSTLIARKLFQSSRAFYASPGYLAEHGKPLETTDLIAHRAILLPQDNPRYWPILGEQRLCNRALSCNNITFAREAAIAGAGIVGLPRMMCLEALERGQLIELLPGVPLPVGEIYAVYPSRRFQALKVRAFLDFVIERLPPDDRDMLEP